MSTRKKVAVIDLAEEFEKHEDDYGRFERITNPLHPRSDLCAFLLLEKLAPVQSEPDSDIVSSAEHDQIWLATDLYLLAQNATSDDILTLVRCGVMYDDGDEALSMFV